MTIATRSWSMTPRLSRVSEQARGTLGSRRRVVEIDRDSEDSPNRFAVDLINQQLWCWGCDARDPVGNRLVKHGFRRLPPPVGIEAPSIYWLDNSSRSRLVLHAYGVFFGNDQLGSIFLRRHSLRPEYHILSRPSALNWLESAAPEPAHEKATNRAATIALTSRMSRVIADYEQLIADDFGTECRLCDVARWHPRDGRVFRGDQLASAWLRLAHIAENQPDRLWTGVPTPIGIKTKAS
ncbi:hypothetical protein Pan44_46220 [Caulifigura coniformis]|uniref:Uncharacterized protein n=1 Tax=Caulifigura coniformis TaxID=2527983 RepID=A0A517SKC5_9PLAN|nr:hypothetical protein [Caulifigura coniformis]QDT56566.1 hypothetical protein Pan44_46220 [Caulifigura coniformis]